MTPRPAQADEAADLARVHALAFDSPWPAADIAALMSGAGGFVLAADGKSRLAGFVLCRAVAGEAEILTLAVDPAARRQGVAVALVVAAAQLAGAMGAETIFLEVAVDNTPAVDLYAKTGFVHAGRRPRYYERGPDMFVDALVMRLELGGEAFGPRGAGDGD